MDTNNRLNKIIKARKNLCAALRSGHYKQATGAFYFSPLCCYDDAGVDTFCILGLAWHLVFPKESLRQINFPFALDTMRNEYGFTDFEAQELLSANDAKTSFSKLADMIEAMRVHVDQGHD